MTWLEGGMAKPEQEDALELEVVVAVVAQPPLLDLGEKLGQLPEMGVWIVVPGMEESISQVVE